MVEIRGQQSTDWRDVYAMRIATAGALPYIRPDWVREELAKPTERTWPLVAVAELEGRPTVVARANIQLGWGRRGHVATLTLEQHPSVGDEGSRSVLQEAVHVAEDWFNTRRLQTTLSSTDPAHIALFESLGFTQEARLRQSVRIAGELIDEIVLARLSGDAARLTRSRGPAPAASTDRRRPRPHITIRGGSIDDWEAQHAIWSQPEVIWGTMQMPYASADWNRQRIQERAPARFWPLMAEVDGKVVGITGLQWDERNRMHVGHLGMMVHADYQAMGVGSALLQAAIELAENWMGMTRLQLEVYTDNARALALYTRHGFEVEGLHRADSFRDRQYVDTLVMGRLRNA